MQLSQKTQDWGNSTGIRLPKKVLKAAKWQDAQEVKIDVRGQSIVLTPLKVKKAKDKLPTLEELVAGITPENRHKEIDWGSPVGKEIW